MQADHGGEVIAGGVRRRALLLRLLIDANRVVSADRLADDLWDGSPPPAAAATLQSHISHLRKIVGADRLVSEGGGYRLVVADGELDAAVFEMELTRGRGLLGAGDPGAAEPVLSRALDRWRGQALADVAATSWALPAAARLGELRLVAMDALLEVRLALGRHAEVVADAEAAVAEHPLRERLWAHLIVALYRCGRQAEALGAYRRLCTHLGDELGLEPSEELVALERAVLMHDPALDGHDPSGSPASLAFTGGSPATPDRSSMPTGTVTFLFTDVEESTKLLERMGDAYGGLLDQHRALVADAVGRHGGHVFGTEGDAIFCVFGRPSDAVEAALAAQRAFIDHEWPEGVRVRVRMGVHSGEVRFLGREYVGLALHHAARIASAGHGSQVLVSDASRVLLGGQLPPGTDLRDLGTYRLKDIADTQRIHQLCRGDLPTDFPPIRAFGLEGLPEDQDLIVGRDRELAQFLARLERIFGGLGQLVLIGGEPGIGKSRLLDEFAERADERGATVLWGRCWEAGGAPAYWPWIQSIRAYIRVTDRETVRSQLGRVGADVAKMVPEVREIIGDPVPMVESDPEGARFRLFDATATFLRVASMERPLVIVLDDLHAADEPSLLLLQFLTAEIVASRVLIVAAYRESELGPDHPLTAVLADSARTRGVLRLHLDGWGEEDVRRFIEVTAGHMPPARLISDLLDGTGGNPLFVGEVVRLLVSEGRLDADRGGPWHAVIPAGVKEAIGQRTARLSAECRDALTLASVLGREFSLEALARASELPEDRLVDVLDEAISAQLLIEAPGGVDLRFLHFLVRDALYEELTPARRIRLHRRVGELLEEFYARDAESHLAELAHHFLQSAPGGDRERAVRYARRAAEHAALALAYEEAARLYLMALRTLQLGGADQETLCEVLLGLGDAQARAGDIPSARENFLAAADVARRRDLPELLARAALGYGGRFVWDVARGDQHLAPMLREALKGLGEGALRVRLLARLAGGPLRESPDREERDSLSREAVESARRLGDAAALAYALDGRYAAVWWPENLEERLHIASELIDVATGAGDEERAVQGHHYRFLARFEAGDVVGAKADLQAEERMAEELRQPAQLGHAAADRATVAAFEGRFAEAEELANQAFRLAEPAQGSSARIYYALQIYALRSAVGRLDEILEPLDLLAREFPMYPVLRCVLAHVLAQTERGPQARRILNDLGSDNFGTLLRDEEWLFGLGLLAEVASLVGESGRGAALYEMLVPYAARNAVSAPDVCTGSLSRNLGNLASMLSRWDEAALNFEAALDSNERMGGRPWTARTEHDYAAMLLRRGWDGDRARARELLVAARRTCDELGMRSLGKKVTSLVRDLDRC